MEKCLHRFDRYDELHYGFETEFIRILYYDLPEAYEEKYTSYECSKLCTILEGKKEVGINGAGRFAYGSEEMILLPPGSSVEMTIQAPTKALVFELSGVLIERVKDTVAEEFDLTEDSGPEEVVLCRPGEAALVAETVARMRRYLRSGREDNRFLIDLAAQEMAYHLLRRQICAKCLRSDSKHPVFRAIRDIREHLPAIRHVKDLADNYNMSHTHFTHMFKRITGLTPHEYITNQKMILARSLLQTQTVTEVAYNLNYENISHFIALFKKKYGITPKQYQLNRQTRTGHGPSSS